MRYYVRAYSLKFVNLREGVRYVGRRKITRGLFGGIRNEAVQQNLVVPGYLKRQLAVYTWSIINGVVTVIEEDV